MTGITVFDILEGCPPAAENLWPNDPGNVTRPMEKRPIDE